MYSNCFRKKNNIVFFTKITYNILTFLILLVINSKINIYFTDTYLYIATLQNNNENKFI